MRILTLCQKLERGGSGRVAQNFTLAYRAMGHDVAVMTLRGTGPRQAILEAAGVPVYLGHEDFAAAIGRADAFAPDLIHIHRPGFANDGETRALVRLRQGHRRVIETNVFARIDYSRGRELIDVHMLLSKWCMWRWRKWLGASRGSVAGVVVPNPVVASGMVPADAAVRAAWRRDQNIPADAYVCGRIGQPNWPNWHAATIDAFAHLASLNPAAHLVLLGLPPELEPALAALHADARRRVVLLPVTDSDAELSRVYSALDCFLHAAHSGESFGMVLAEAMMCGTPVVTASRPHKSNSQVEVVGNRKGGLVAASTRDLGQVAETLWRDEPLRRQISAGAREWVLSRFEVSRVAAQALEVGRIALAAKDRSDLIQKLEGSGLPTRTTDAEARQLLRDTIGHASPSELFQKRLVHIPLVQRYIAYRLRHIANPPEPPAPVSVPQ